jgi:hypothetical protein
MKKFFALTLGILFSFQASVASAGTIYGMKDSDLSPFLKATVKFNQWLYADNYRGTNYINDNYYRLREEAVKWDKDALLFGVEVFGPGFGADPQEFGCLYMFGSVNKPEELFVGLCVDLSAQAPSFQTVSAQGQDYMTDLLFDLPELNLRRFVSNLFASTEVLNKLNSLTTENIAFRLTRNEQGVHWTLSELGMGTPPPVVSADASNVNSPFEIN